MIFTAAGAGSGARGASRRIGAVGSRETSFTGAGVGVGARFGAGAATGAAECVSAGRTRAVRRPGGMLAAAGFDHAAVFAAAAGGGSFLAAGFGSAFAATGVCLTGVGATFATTGFAATGFAAILAGAGFAMAAGFGSIFFAAAGFASTFFATTIGFDSTFFAIAGFGSIFAGATFGSAFGGGDFVTIVSFAVGAFITTVSLFAIGGAFITTVSLFATGGADGRAVELGGAGGGTYELRVTSLGIGPALRRISDVCPGFASRVTERGSPLLSAGAGEDGTRGVFAAAGEAGGSISVLRAA